MPLQALLEALLLERAPWCLAELAKSACRAWCLGVRSSQVCPGQSGQWSFQERRVGLASCLMRRSRESRALWVPLGQGVLAPWAMAETALPVRWVPGRQRGEEQLGLKEPALLRCLP